jgi:hypothetical protein
MIATAAGLGFEAAQGERFIDGSKYEIASRFGLEGRPEIVMRGSRV